MTSKQIAPTRLTPEALETLKKYQDIISETTVIKIKVFPSDAIRYMDKLINDLKSKAIVPPQDVDDGLIREVKYSGGKATINMPKNTTGKRYKLIEVKE